MFEDHFASTFDKAKTISAFAKAKREALNTSLPFHHLAKVLRNKGYRISGDGDSLTIAPFYNFDDQEGYGAESLAVLRKNLK